MSPPEALGSKLEAQMRMPFLDFQSFDSYFFLNQIYGNAKNIIYGWPNYSSVLPVMAHFS